MKRLGHHLVVVRMPFLSKLPRRRRAGTPTSALKYDPWWRERQSSPFANLLLLEQHSLHLTLDEREGVSRPDQRSPATGAGAFSARRPLHHLTERRAAAGLIPRLHAVMIPHGSYGIIHGMTYACAQAKSPINVARTTLCQNVLRSISPS